MATAERITIRKPDDWHVHLRDGDILKTVAPLTARQFNRALVMPNLTPPITAAAIAKDYRQRIIATANYPDFTPFMACYLTDHVNVYDLELGFQERIFLAAKLYPANATTNSDFGVTSLKKIYHAFYNMEKIGMPLCVHGETVAWNGKRVDPYDRETVFINEELRPLRREFPDLKIVLEHVTTREGVKYVLEDKRFGKLGATITAHHLWISREDVFEGGICADLHCLPVAKTEGDRIALRKAATSGNSHFFLGTDSAPHPLRAKRRHRAPGGIFTAHAAIELYAQVFDEENALDKLERFASVNGALFYGCGVIRNEPKMTLERNPWTVDETVKIKNTDDVINPFLYEENPALRRPINWRIVNE